MTVRLSGAPRREGLWAVDRRLLRSRASRMLRALSRSRSELSVSLVDDAEIAALNSAYRGRSRPTDVLAFSLLEGEDAEHRGALLGDVVIGVEAAARQARARHQALDDELARLLIHGTLHLLGHEHRRAEPARAMRAEERRLWRALRDGDDARRRSRRAARRSRAESTARRRSRRAARRSRAESSVRNAD